MNALNNATGFVPEDELELLTAEADDVAGGTTWWCLTITITLTWRYCPTNGCTDQCTR